MENRPLGGSGIDVSALALGSWRTYERMTREQGVAVMTAAREAGITLLDDARYNDETGRAPIPTGYSEVVFGELFRTSGWPRDEAIVANKLWWEFWPGETAEQELDASLRRMGFDHVDLIYACGPPEGLGAEEIVTSVAGLLAAGKARAWGVCNWPPALLTEAVGIARAEGLPAPCAAQLAYNLVYRETVEGDADAAALEAAGVGVVASASLAFGALSGKYASRDATGRIAGKLEEPFVKEAIAAARPLAEIAERLDATPAALALAFALAGPRVATVLFGATTPEQIRENVQAVDVLASLDGDALEELRAVGRAVAR
jgi:aryl-alcohol dehydrogenase-like predicted oxidoreductase